MSTFSPSDAAFEGFRVIHRHPGAVLGWAIARILIFLVIGGLALTLFGPQLTELSSYSGAGRTMAPEQALRFAGSMGLFGLLAIPIGLLISAIFVAAVFRPVLRPDDKGLLFLKIGGDEWRLVLLTLAYVGLFILAEIVLALTIVILSLLGGAALHLSTGGGGVGALVGVLLGLALFLACFWVAVRLSLAGPMTFAERRVQVFGSWGVTRGRFWSLFGCYLLAWIFAVLVGVLGWVVSVAANAAISGDWSAMSSAMNPRAMIVNGQLNMLTHLMSAGVIVQLVLSTLFQTVSRVIMYAPMAAAYRDLTGGESCPLTGDAPARTGDGLVL